MQHHEMNTSVSILLVGSLEACLSHVNSFSFKFFYPCWWEMFLELNKETSCEIDMVRKWQHKRDKRFFQVCIGFHQDQKKSVTGKQSKQNKWGSTQFYRKSFFNGSYHFCLFFFFSTHGFKARWLKNYHITRTSNCLRKN